MTSNKQPAIQGDALVVEGSEPIKTNLQELRYLGVIRSVRGEPFYLVTGRACPAQNCPTNVHAFQGGSVNRQSARPVTFVLPGQVLDTRTRSVVLKSRAFFGKCLPSAQTRHQDYYVVFQEERIDRKKRLQPSVFVARPDSPYWAERLIATKASRLPKLKDTLKAVKTGACHEIEGRNRTSIRKPYHVNLPSAIEPGDEDDGEQTTSGAAGDKKN